MRKRKHLVEKMAQALLEKEVLNLEQLEALLGQRPFKIEGLGQRNIDKYAGRGGDEGAHTQESKKEAGISDDPAVDTAVAETPAEARPAEPKRVAKPALKPSPLNAADDDSSSM